MAKHAHTTGAPRRRQSAAGADLFPQTGENPLSPTEAGIPALPARRLRTAFYAAGHLLPIDFADRVALLERRERILDLAEALLDLADAMDTPLEDREPEPVEAEDDEATQQPVTLAPDWLRTKNGRRTEKVSHGATPRHRRQVGSDGARPFRAGKDADLAPFHAFRAPGEPLPSRPAEMPVPLPANCPPGFDSDGNPTEPKRRSSQFENSSLATGLRNACLAGTGFWVLVGLAGWRLLA